MSFDADVKPVCVEDPGNASELGKGVRNQPRLSAIEEPNFSQAEYQPFRGDPHFDFVVSDFTAKDALQFALQSKRFFRSASVYFSLRQCRHCSAIRRRRCGSPGWLAVPWQTLPSAGRPLEWQWIVPRPFSCPFPPKHTEPRRKRITR